MTKQKNEKHSKIIEDALSRFDIAIQANKENREEAILDAKFRAGDQWPAEVVALRQLQSRPCLTINKMPQNVHQITNDQRQNRPSIKVSPFDDNADIKTSEILQGLIRSIENFSNADTAYDIGFDKAVEGGRGFIRLTTDFADPTSFDQDIKIVPVHDPHSVLIDPAYREPDGSDANWAFHFDDIAIEDFKSQYPSADCAVDDFNHHLEKNSTWFDEKTIRVAEYFVRELKEDKLYLLPDGSTALKSEIDDLTEEKLLELGLDDEILENSKVRKTMIPEIKWYKICGNEVLEETVWPSRWIPIIPIHGEELFVDGKRIFEGVIRHARDPQRMYNYWATCETETIALAPKPKFIGAAGQFEGHEDAWNNIHLDNTSYIEYNNESFEGKLVPAPQRINTESNVGAITQARMLSSDDLKSTTGIYDASLGNRSNEVSGKAINQRAQQSQVGNFHFVDNLSRSLRHVGKIMLELIPVIYDTKRVVRILGEDDQEEIVTINEMFKDNKGKSFLYEFGKGKYDCTVTTGPSYASKRQEALQAMLDLSKVYPQLTQYAGDLIVKNIDMPNADELAKRIKKSMPPEITGDEEDEIPPHAQAQIAQMGKMLQEKEQQLGQAMSAIEEMDKTIDSKELEIQSRERIALHSDETKMTIELAKLQALKGAETLQSQILKLQFELEEKHKENEEKIIQALNPVNLANEMPLVEPTLNVDGENYE